MGKKIKKKSLENLKKGFKANPQNINRKGRPRRTVTTLLEEIKKAGGVELKPVDLKALYLALLDRTQEELVAYASDKTLSMVVRIVAKAMLEKRGFDIIERMLDRSVGRPTNLIGEDKDHPLTIVDVLKNIAKKHTEDKEKMEEKQKPTVKVERKRKKPGN